MIELTVHWQGHIGKVNDRKGAKYQDLVKGIVGIAQAEIACFL